MSPTEQATMFIRLRLPTTLPNLHNSLAAGLDKDLNLVDTLCEMKIIWALVIWERGGKRA